MKLSIIIPAHNEQENIEGTVINLVNTLEMKRIDYEVLVVNDHSTDSTPQLIDRLSSQNRNIKRIDNQWGNGFGFAVRAGLDSYCGEAVVIYMADESDSPQDVIEYYNVLSDGYDCVFGSRFIRGGAVVDYPFHKLLLNRAANWFIKILFNLDYNNVTNAFKGYSHEVIKGFRHFSQTTLT